MEFALGLIAVRAGGRLPVRGRCSSLGTVALRMPLSMPLPLTLAGTRMPVFGGEHDLQLVQLVPFLFGAIPVGYRPKLLQARSRRIRLRLVHDRYYLILGRFIGIPDVAKPGVGRSRSDTLRPCSRNS